MPEIYISELYVYPIKSLGGISLSRSSLDERGLLYDRRWLIINSRGEAVTQRTKPQMVHFEVEILEDHLRVSFENESVDVPLSFKKQIQREANVWGNLFKVWEISGDLNKWFSQKLGEEVFFVFQDKDAKRLIDPKFATEENQIVSAADAYPVLIISEESLNHLNTQLNHKVEMLRFRPNIVVKGGGEPHYEDTWVKVCMGGTEIIGVKNCARCSMVTNDIRTATFGKEPLKTLSKYRRVYDKVIFGRNFIPLKYGELKVGDRVLFS